VCSFELRWTVECDHGHERLLMAKMQSLIRGLGCAVFRSSTDTSSMLYVGAALSVPRGSSPLATACQFVSSFVCPFVCLHTFVRNHVSELYQKFSVHVVCGCGSIGPPLAGGIAVCYVLPVLWMTSFI